MSETPSPPSAIDRPKPEDKTSLEAQRDACNYAIDFNKQFLTLAAAGIAFVVGLVFADKGTTLPFYAVAGSLITFGLSMFFGLLCFSNIIGDVAMKGSYAVYGGFIQLAAVLQIFLFGIGLLLLFGPTIGRACSAQPAVTLAPAPASTNPPSPPATASPGGSPPPQRSRNTNSKKAHPALPSVTLT